MSRKTAFFTIQCLLGLTVSVIFATHTFAANGKIVRHVVAAGGGVNNAGGASQFFTIGQPIVQTFTSSTNTIKSGFWSVPNTAVCCQLTTGNVDCDAGSSVDIADLTTLVDFLFVSMNPLCCQAEANIEKDAVIDIFDMTALVDHLFLGFQPLPTCRGN
jgi:hypothetical protein